MDEFKLALIAAALAAIFMGVIGIYGIVKRTLEIDIKTYVGVKEFMSKLDQIKQSLTSSEEQITLAATTIVGFGPTIQAIRDDVAALKEAADAGNIETIKNIAESINGKAAGMTQSLSQLGQDLVAIDESVPPAEEPPLEEE